MSSLKIKSYNVKRKLNNMEHIQKEYCEMDIWKVNKVNFLNGQVEEFTSKWNQNSVNIRRPTYLKQKRTLNIDYEA